jgi:hypothetical protein
MIILPLGLLGGFPALWKTGKFPPFLGGGRRDYLLDTKIFLHLQYLPLVDKYLKSWEGLKIDTPHSTIVAS